MTDIVETLRQRREVEYIGGHVHVVWEDKEALEAADELHNLRALLRVAMGYVWAAAHHSKDPDTAAEAKEDLAEMRKALEAKDE